MRDIVAMAVTSGLILGLAVSATASRGLQACLDRIHAGVSDIRSIR